MNMSPGVKQIIETLRPYRTEAMINYVSLKRISKFVTRIEKRSRSKNIKQDVHVSLKDIFNGKNMNITITRKSIDTDNISTETFI